MDNPLLREPLRREHIKPRLLGHWGTTPGLNFLYAHLNRVIKARDLDAIYVIGPGHGGPATVVNAYLEGTYSEVYPNITRDEDGIRALFRQFSFPGGIGSHVTPETPGSIHEGGELGYSLSHAYGAAFDNPDLVVFCVVGDGEAETGSKHHQPMDAVLGHQLGGFVERCRREDPGRSGRELGPASAPRRLPHGQSGR